MAFIKKVNFANFTCTFEDEGMLVFFNDIIFPAFKEKAHKRLIRGSEYFFIDTQIKKEIIDNTPYIYLVGRIVKNTKLKRDQIYNDDKGIIEDHDELETAPTSLFLLILNSHRLLYVKEVSGAPNLSAFQATCTKFIKDSRLKLIDKLYRENKEKVLSQGVSQITKRQLYRMYPPCSLRITPLMGSRELKDFIENFFRIDTLNINLLKTNSENINNDDFWNKLQDTTEKMESKKASVNFANSKDGLNPDEVYNQCNSAGAMANSKIKLRGRDDYGGTLVGDNDDFSLTIEFDELVKDVNIAGPDLLKRFVDLVKSGTIQIPKVSKSVSEQLKNIANIFF